MGTIQIRGKKKRIRLVFSYNGRRFENTDFYCSGNGDKTCKCRDCKAAAILLDTVELNMKSPVFDYFRYFPNTSYRDLKEKNTKQIINKSIKFGVYAQIWYPLQKNNVAHSTYVSYNSILNNLIAFFGDYHVDEINKGDVRRYISSLKVSAKTMKNRLNVLSLIMQMAIDDEIISQDPCLGTKLPKSQKKYADPFEIYEVKAILDWFEEHRPQMAAFYAVGFYCGLRTGERMGLKWSDIDFRRRLIRVRRTITHGEVKESTKNGSERDVPILDTLMPYLQNQKAQTFMKGIAGASDWMFLNNADEPFRSYANLTEHYWGPCLKALGVRYRQPYHVRHTYACLAIEAGEDLNWIKDVLGHRSLEMLMRIYGNRIRSRIDRGGHKMTDLLQSVPESVPNDFCDKKVFVDKGKI